MKSFRQNFWKYLRIKIAFFDDLETLNFNFWKISALKKGSNSPKPKFKNTKLSKSNFQDSKVSKIDLHKKISDSKFVTFSHSGKVTSISRKFVK